MNKYRSIIKADYLQRTRSYIFIITLLASAFAAYSFVPDDNAPYSTVRIGNYVGYNNAAWIGHVTAIMTSVFLWVVGFYIVNNGIRRDGETGVGPIIASTSISNYAYLFAKSLSNFLILLTITGVTILIALGLVIYRGQEYTFNIVQFLMPFLLVTLPGLFCLSVLAVFFEVVFGNKTNLLNILFFVLFLFIVAITSASNNPNVIWFDVIGIKYLTDQLALFVSSNIPNGEHEISVGFIIDGSNKPSHFLFEGSHFSLFYILSRLLWIGTSLGLLAISAKLFNRFESKRKKPSKTKKSISAEALEESNNQKIKLAGLSKTSTDYSILPLVKTELKLLLSYGPKWFWLVNLAGFIALLVMPLNTAHQIGLPVLWFLQVNRWATLSTKEKHFGTGSFIFSTYKPIQRLLSAQLFAGILLALTFALPLLLRFALVGETSNLFEIVLGAITLIAFSIFSGIIFSGKRFFEIVFFIITFFIIQGGGFADYLGCLQSGHSYLFVQISMSLILIFLAFVARNLALSKY
ncbi:MAG: hypothetical protein JWP69_1719 [Flaviaesturariibacter sp.]|nr:hypothetical protein [Flaviaesturariibacter sp.]